MLPKRHEALQEFKRYAFRAAAMAQAYAIPANQTAQRSEFVENACQARHMPIASGPDSGTMLPVNAPLHAWPDWDP